MIIEINQDGIPITLDQDDATILAAHLCYAIGMTGTRAKKITIRTDMFDKEDSDVRVEE